MAKNLSKNQPKKKKQKETKEYKIRFIHDPCRRRKYGYVQMKESKNYVELRKLTKIDDHCCMQFL